jgi:hypothetical protein
LIGIVVAILAIGAVAYFVFPSFRAKADALYEKHGGWSDEARRKDPVGFIKHSIDKLEANIAKFDLIKAEVRGGKATLEKMKQETQAKQTFAENQLAEFKTAFKNAKATNAWPVAIAGRKYSEAELKSQVELTLSEKATFDGVLGRLEQNVKDFEAKEAEVVNRITESKSKLGWLKTEVEIVKLNKLSAETEKMMDQVNDVLIANDAVKSEVVVRTTDELMKDAKAAVKATPKADEFLNS